MRAADSGALGWFDARWQAVRDDHYRLHDTAWMDPAAEAIMVDIDRGALASLTPNSRCPASFSATRPSVFRCSALPARRGGSRDGLMS